MPSGYRRCPCTKALYRKPVAFLRRADKGKYKTEPNSPWLPGGGLHEYCPPLEVDGQMEALVKMFGEITPDKATAEVRAAWLHHAFTQIHPFQDGNGRVARALASLVLIKGGLPPLIVPNEMRDRYILSLESADYGRSERLVDLFESCLYRQVVSLWHQTRFDRRMDVSPESTLEAIIQAAQARLLAKHGRSPIEWNTANAHMLGLVPVALRLVTVLSSSLTASLRQVNSKFNAIPGEIDGPIEDSGYSIAALEAWGTEARSTGHNSRAVVLTINADQQAKIFTVFDSFSNTRQGICGIAVALSLGGELQPIEPSFFFSFAD